MTNYVLLGIVQGLTEFLPVSSSGHLVLAERLLGLNPPGVLFETCLHLGTLAAILLLFRSDLAALARALTLRGSIERRKEIGLLILGTVPILGVGLLLRGRIDEIFASLPIVGGGLLLSGVALLLAGRCRKRATRQEFRVVDAAIVGVAQAASVFPGVSRSGTSISFGVLAGVSPERAARFSFLLAIPALAGAGLLSLWDVVRAGHSASADWLGIAIGTLVAFGVGIAAIRVLLAVVARGRLWVFAAYCLALGTGVLVWAAF
jgi:undecaprenyl-diphosphatase